MSRSGSKKVSRSRSKSDAADTKQDSTIADGRSNSNRNRDSSPEERYKRKRSPVRRSRDSRHCFDFKVFMQEEFLDSEPL